MSTLYAEVVNIEYVKPHPNADRLDIAIVHGTTVVVQKGAFARGDTAIYFPADLLLKTENAEALGVAKYLKHSRYPGTEESTPCRVAACRLRGQPSFGFLAPLSALNPDTCPDPLVGDNVSHFFGAIKYEPPQRELHGDAEPEYFAFHRYTDIEHLWRFPGAIEPGTPVRITEKIHGTNSRVGLCRNLATGEFELMAGSHKVRRKAPPEGATSMYWQPLEVVTPLLETLSADQHNIVVFGEIFGMGIQDMDYGQLRGYRVFDITRDGKYLDWAEVAEACKAHYVETVPLLYEGPFDIGLVEKFTYGQTTLANRDEIRSQFKDREGCVITPLTEQHYAPCGGRLIFKCVSADYLDRKGAKDLE